MYGDVKNWNKRRGREKADIVLTWESDSEEDSSVSGDEGERDEEGESREANDRVVLTRQKSTFNTSSDFVWKK